MSKNRTKQRSWSDYDGDNPIKSWDKKGFYTGQPLPVPYAPDYMPEKKEPEITFTPRRRKRSSALQNAMDGLGMK